MVDVRPLRPTSSAYAIFRIKAERANVCVGIYMFISFVSHFYSFFVVFYISISIFVWKDRYVSTRYMYLDAV